MIVCVVGSNRNLTGAIDIAIGLRTNTNHEHDHVAGLPHAFKITLAILPPRIATSCAPVSAVAACGQPK